MAQEEITIADVAACKPDCVAGAGLVAKAEAVGLGKADMPAGKTFWLAVAAGLFIATGALFMTYMKADQTLGFAAANLLGGVVFSIGLIMVVIAGAELFTGNSLMVIGALKGKYSWGALGRNWVLVWVGNLVGSLVMVALVVGAGVMATKAGDNTIGNQMVTIAAGKEGLSAGVIFFRGILCNFLVCMAVWMGFAGRTVVDKVLTCVFPVAAFVCMGFEHCIANMFFLPVGTLASMMDYGSVGVLAWSGCVYNILLATAGNIVGGAVFVGVLYWLAYRK
jgi:formate/nitrite transporter